MKRLSLIEIMIIAIVMAAAITVLVSAFTPINSALRATCSFVNAAGLIYILYLYNRRRK